MQKLSPVKARQASELFDRGLSLMQGGDAEAAIYAFEAAQKLVPLHFDVVHMLGVAHMAAHQPEFAVRLLRRAAGLRPTDAMARMNLGLALHAQGNLMEAIDNFGRADKLQTGDLRINYNLANALADAGKVQDAIRRYEAALRIQPDCAEVLHALGNLLRDSGAYAEAASCCERLLQLEPERPRGHGRLVHLKARACLWSTFERDYGALLERITAGQDAAEPFDLLSIPSNLAQQLRAARCFAEKEFPASGTGWQPPPRRDGRIRIGYFSADFHDHATAFLMAELFELHDRGRFEIHAFSFGPQRSGTMRPRLEAAIEHFTDVSLLTDAEIVAQARACELDIAIDLKGYTTHSRAGIFAARVAPIQVNYLGYPGTMGASFIDYIIADHNLIPAGQEAHYSEKVLRLPHCYQPNDRRRPVADASPARAALGLPAEGFVFCCFNNSFKITPDVFAIWMHLLLQTPGSVLWLLEDNKTAADNLRSEAEAHGIDPQRLVFAPRLPLAEHLARHRQADLFVDTFHYNAHTTASDALWAGLPVVTCAGNTFASRVGASLLRACNLPELVTESAADYADLCLALARDPERLAALRSRLGEKPTRLPLFNTPVFTRHLEMAFEAMHTRHQSGLIPDHITVNA